MLPKNFTGCTVRKRVLDASDGSCLFYVQLSEIANGENYSHTNIAVPDEKSADKLVEALTTLSLDIVEEK